VQSIQYTERVKRIIEIASENITEHQAVTPLHLFLAMCEENSGVCAELHYYLARSYGFSFIDDFSKYLEPFHPNPINVASLPFKVSPEMVHVLNLAEQRMKRYNQLHLNEGHIMQAILRLNTCIYKFLTNEDIAAIEEIVCRARDMIVHLESYNLPEEVLQVSYVRKASVNDAGEVIRLVESEFGSGWIEAVKNSFTHEDTSIFVALEYGRIVGFACYEAHGKKRGTFGPMGVSSRRRQKGVGAYLLHHCLSELKKKRYKYAIIEGAGPVEFYEKTVHALLIPIPILAKETHHV
jgi:predicted N-acetyltransferase YhbS